MIISIIAAIDKNRTIGKNNQLPWHLPADLAHFKSLTWGKPIVMGRKTHESIGKPLPGRRNVIVSKRERVIEGCEVFRSLTEALQALSTEEEVMIIGGASIFQQTLPLADKMYLTIIDAEFQGDTFFPFWNSEEWKIISEQSFQSDQKNRYSYRFLALEKQTSKDIQ